MTTVRRIGGSAGLRLHWAAVGRHDSRQRHDGSARLAIGWLLPTEGYFRLMPCSTDQEPSILVPPDPAVSRPSRRALCPEDLDAVHCRQSPATMVIGC